MAQSGARVEVMLAPSPPRNVSAMARGAMPRSRAASTNQGIVVTPFHSMLLICPATTAAQVERYLSAFGAFCRQLASLSAQA